MKSKFKLVLIFVISFIFSINNVYASASFDGGGVSAGLNGGKDNSYNDSYTCGGGYCLSVTPIIKFSLVDVSGENLRIVPASTSCSFSEYFMVNQYVEEGKKLSPAYYFKYLVNENVSGKNAIYGRIKDDGTYDAGAYVPDEFPKELYFSNINSIVSVSTSGFTFNASQLKSAIVNNCDSNGHNCQSTSKYERIVLYMLKNAGIINQDYSHLDDIDINIRKTFDKYRVIIEPVHALKKSNGNGYKFMTTKALAKIAKETESCSDGWCFGFANAGNLYNNLYAMERVNNVLNNPNYIGYNNSDGYRFDAMALSSNGAGYAIVNLSYASCDIYNDLQRGLLFKDKSGNAYDFNGDNLGYFLGDSQCGCDMFNNSEFKDILLNDSNLKNQYDTSCPSIRKCEYEIKDNKYTFYDNNGNALSNYTDFVKSCDCENEKVEELKNDFGDIYSNMCVSPSTPPSTEEITNNLDVCKKENDSENYEITYTISKSINNYCKKKCVENIKFNDVYGKYSVQAGKIFSLGKYPNLIATKSCEVNIDYNGWVSRYSSLLKKLVDAYNEWQKAANTTESFSSCSCGEDCTSTMYFYEYDYTKIIKNGTTTLSTSRDYNSYHNRCGEGRDNLNVVQKKGDFISISTKIVELQKMLKTCSTELAGERNEIQDTQFYNFKQNLKYYYEQTSADNSKTYTYRNDNKRSKNIDDSKLSDNDPESSSSGNYKLTSNTGFQYDTIEINGKQTVYLGIDGVINRKRIITYNYSPSIKKYTDGYSGEIVNYDNSSLLNNPIYLGNVYDTDISSLSKDLNNNSFEFEALGDNNQIYNYYENNSKLDKLKRQCSYKITNNVITKKEKVFSNLVYRVVDPSNIDPNNRIDKTDEGMSNWKSAKASAVIEDMINDLYNPNDVEYSFTLDSAKLEEIRKKNSTSNYSNFVLKCNNSSDGVEGAECQSDFVTKYASKHNGRNMWKYFIYDSSKNKWSLKTDYKTGDMTQTQFDILSSQLGSGLQP